MKVLTQVEKIILFPFFTPKALPHSAMTVSVTHGQTTTTTTHPHPTTAAMARPTSPGNSSGSETDQVTGTALRRLYFKSGRHARARGPAVPKVKLYFNFNRLCGLIEHILQFKKKMN